MKKILAVMLTLTLTLGLAACGGKDAPGDTAGKPDDSIQTAHPGPCSGTPRRPGGGAGGP